MSAFCDGFAGSYPATRFAPSRRWDGRECGTACSCDAAEEFDAFVTVDQGIEFQQQLVGVAMAVIIMASQSNDIGALRPLLPQVLAALASTPAGEICLVRG
jgi:hypothetical protein